MLHANRENIFKTKISRSTVWFEHRPYLVWIVLFQGCHFSPRYFSCTARDKSLRKSRRLRQMCRAPGRNHVHVWLDTNVSVCESCCVTAAVRLGIGLGLFVLWVQNPQCSSPWKMLFTGAHLMSICPTESGRCHELSHTFLTICWVNTLIINFRYMCPNLLWDSWLAVMENT